MAKKKLTKIEEITEAADKVVAFWMDYRKYFRKAFVTQPITPEEEQHFLKTKSDVTRMQRVLHQRLPENFRYGHKRMTDIMAQSVSIAALRDLPMPDKRAIYQKWHESYIALQNLRGVVAVMADGYKVEFESAQAKTGNIKQQMSSSDSDEKKSGGAIKVVAILAALGGAGWYFFTKMQ